MSRWIDYDAIDYRNDKLHDKSEEFLNGVIYMAQRIEEAPSIDIVRCKECKHRKPSGCVGSIKTYECDITGFRMHDLTNHFCSYGEVSKIPTGSERSSE